MNSEQHLQWGIFDNPRSSNNNGLLMEKTLPWLQANFDLVKQCRQVECGHCVDRKMLFVLSVFLVKVPLIMRADKHGPPPLALLNPKMILC